MCCFRFHMASINDKYVLIAPVLFITILKNQEMWKGKRKFANLLPF